jgi:hypothetical protein
LAANEREEAQIFQEWEEPRQLLVRRLSLSAMSRFLHLRVLAFICG